MRKRVAVIKRLFLLVGMLPLLTSACTTGTRLRGAEQLPLYRAHSGASVDHISYFGSIHSWTPLGDTALAVWTGPGKAYLIDVGHCPGLAWTSAIDVTNTFGRVQARFDRIVMLHSGPASIACPIKQILPLNVKALKQTQRMARAQASKQQS
jgi:hypothetical protein